MGSLAERLRDEEKADCMAMRVMKAADPDGRSTCTLYCRRCREAASHILADAIEAEEAKIAVDAMREAVEERTRAEHDGVIPDGIEWPRWSSGEPIRLGDEFETVGGEIKKIASIRINSHNFELYDKRVGKGPFFWASLKTRLHQYAPEVLDADGVPIKVGDTVWVLPSCETAVTVTDITPGNSRFPVRGMGADWVSDVWRASALTHRRPDTQEAIDDDCMMDAKDYCEKYAIKAEYPKHCGKAKCEHLLMRQRKLLGGE